MVHRLDNLFNRLKKVERPTGEKEKTLRKLQWSRSRKRRPVIPSLLTGVLVVAALLFIMMNLESKEKAFEKHGDQTELQEEIPENLPEETTFALKTDGKETVPIDLLEEKALYKFEGKEGEAEYLVYFYAENGEETPLETNTWRGEAGDVMYSGDYFFYVATKEDDVAYKQEQLDVLSLSFNRETVNNATISMDDYTLISVFSHEGADSHNAYLYSLNDGELAKIDSSELRTVFAPKIKAIDDNKLQTVSYWKEAEEDDIGWHFQTFEVDRESFALTPIADEVFNDTYPPYWRLDAGHERFLLWINDEESIVPYRDVNDLEKIEITKEMLTLAASNELGDIPVKLGDNMEDLMEQNKGMTAKIWHSGSKRVYFLEYVVSYNPYSFNPMPGPLDYSGEVVLLEIPPERIQMTVDEIIDVLGEPTESRDYNGYTQEYSIIYDLGDNILMFTYRDIGDDVTAVLRYRFQ